MSEPQFTPGPWRVRENARNSPDKCDLSICGDIFVLADLRGPQYAHQHANANLIAAAPELLAALEAFVDSDNPDSIDTRYENAREAICKARGEQVRS